MTAPCRQDCRPLPACFQCGAQRLRRAAGVWLTAPLATQARYRRAPAIATCRAACPARPVWRSTVRCPRTRREPGRWRRRQFADRSRRAARWQAMYTVSGAMTWAAFQGKTGHRVDEYISINNGNIAKLAHCRCNSMAAVSFKLMILCWRPCRHNAPGRQNKSMMYFFF